MIIEHTVNKTCLPRLATSNTVYLEGLVEDLRAKLGQMEELERECVSLRVELGLAQGRLSEWTRLAYAVLGVSSVSGPAALRRCVESLQQRELSLTQDKAAVESALKNLGETHKETLKELQEANAQLVNTKRSLELQSTKVRRLRKQITLITWVSTLLLKLKRVAGVNKSASFLKCTRVLFNLFATKCQVFQSHRLLIY